VVEGGGGQNVVWVPLVAVAGPDRVLAVHIVPSKGAKHFNAVPLVPVVQPTKASLVPLPPQQRMIGGLSIVVVAQGKEGIQKSLAPGLGGRAHPLASPHMLCEEAPTAPLERHALQIEVQAISEVGWPWPRPSCGPTRVCLRSEAIVVLHGQVQPAVRGVSCPSSGR
jgi:hypothetical protein